MISDANKSATIKLLALLLSLTCATVLLTIFITWMAFPQPHGFAYRTVTLLFCASEILAGMLITNVYARSKCQYQPTGAVTVICFGALATYTIIGLLLTFAQSAIGTDNSAGLFTGALLALTLVMFVATAIIYGVDLYTQQMRAPAIQKTAEHKWTADRLGNSIEECRKLNFSDSQHQVRCSKMLKRLDMIAKGLSHSSGCGLKTSGKEEESSAGKSNLEKALNNFEQLLGDAKSTKPTSEECLDRLERNTSELVAIAEHEGLL